MSAELRVAWGPGEVRGVLLENDRPVALHVERDAAGSLVDAVFLGRIERLVPSLPGAFVAIGLDQPGFLPGQIALPEGSALVVQIVKDARSGKPPELSASVSLNGRLMTWTPARPGVAVSRRIEPGERTRLEGLIGPNLAAGEGVVLRTHAEGAAEADLMADLHRLRRAHHVLTDKASDALPPCRLDTAPGMVERLLARVDGAKLARVAIDDPAACRLAREWYGGGPAPEIVHEPDLAADIGLEDLFEAALAPRVALANGAEIIMETTAAATLVDVNLAGAAGGRAGAAETILAVNRAAAMEIARQLRLRNIGGAIVVDFVSMTGKHHRQDVEAVFRQAIAGDSSPVELHGWTRLGHMELTRRRSTASLAEMLLAAGPLQPHKTARSVALAMLRRIARAPVLPGPITVGLHPSVEALLNGELAPALRAAVERAGRKVILAAGPGPVDRADIDGI